jgi:hypothetical protein
MAIAIRAIVEDNLSRAEAAKLAGLSADAVRKSMRDNPAAREFYAREVKALLHFAKAKAAHALIKELGGPNAAARVAAARTVLEENQQSPAGNGHAADPWLCHFDCRCPRSSDTGRPGAQPDRPSTHIVRLIAGPHSRGVALPVHPTERISQCANYLRSRP